MTPAAALAAAEEITASSRYWLAFLRDACATAGAREYERGQADGYHLAIADLKAFQHGEVRDADLERRRWHLCCPRCRAGHCRPGCPDCQDRTRSAFAAAMPGDYPGRRSAAA